MRRTILAIALLGLVAAGCAGPVEAPPAAVGQDADRTASLTVGNIAPPTSFDPHRATSNRSDPAYLQMVYDQLFRIDTDWTLRPVLAESYDTAPDGLSLTLRLRSGVVFTDGAELDAAAVVASLERARTLEGSTAAPVFRTVTAVTELDAATVRIDFAQPNFTFPIQLATNPNASSIISPTALGNADLGRAPVGSGPYVLESTAPDRAVFTRNEGYWNPDDNPAARLEIVSITDDNARLNALQSGQVDLAFARASQAASYQPLVEAGQVTATEFLGPLTAILLNPAAQPLFADPRVREALNIGIDRAGIVEQFLGGAGLISAQPFPDGMAGHVPGADEVAYDPDRARELLAQAGASDLAFDTILTGTEPLDSIALVIQDQLRRIGVTVETRRYPPADARNAFRQGAAASFIAAPAEGPDPSVFAQAVLLGPDSPGGAPADLQELGRAALQFTADDPGRAAAFEAVTESLSASPYHIFVLRSPVVILADPRVVGVEHSYVPLGNYMNSRGIGVASGA